MHQIIGTRSHIADAIKPFENVIIVVDVYQLMSVYACSYAYSRCLFLPFSIWFRSINHILAKDYNINISFHWCWMRFQVIIIIVFISLLWNFFRLIDIFHSFTFVWSLIFEHTTFYFCLAFSFNCQQYTWTINSAFI